MKYIFLAYGDEKRLNAMSSDEMTELGNACMENDDMLRKNGHLLAVEGLQSSRTATTIRVQKGKLSITDGPFAETKEQLLGIFTIEARDLNEAIQLAAQMPQARGGPIEVRPVAEFEAL